MTRILLTPLFVWASLLLGSAAGSLSSSALETRDTNRNGHWRPQVHFTPPSAWMNDPNGLFQDSHGTYHLYYQYGLACESGGGDKSWGHATSKDLYSWVDQPIAIATSPDLGQIWSGSAIVDNHNLTGLFPKHSGKDNVLAYFTSWKQPEEAQYLAYSLDGGQTFLKYPQDPIISLKRHNFRDPHVVYHKESGKYVIILTLTNAVVFYTSTDLINWTQVSQFNPGLPFMECPQLVRLPRRKSATDRSYIDNTWIVMVSSGSGGPGGASTIQYITGNFDGTTFTPLPGDQGKLKVFDFGPDVYATAFYDFRSQAAIDGKQDAISFSWATNTRYAVGTPTCPEGWRHTQTGPRHHWLDENYKLVGSPVTPVHKRAPIINKHAVRSASVAYQSLAAASNPAIEFELTINAPSTSLSSPVNGSLEFASSSTGEKLSLGFVVTAGTSSPTLQFTMDRHTMQGFDNAGLNTYSTTVGALSVKKHKGAQFTVHGILDRSILEVYINGGTEFGTLLYFPVGTLDTTNLTQPAGGPLSFDFKATPLKSSWGN